jgi:ribosomal protein S18 acetylase RimI-like enzyme
MTEWLLESAATAGIASIKVELRTDNAAAYALYRGLGFVEMLRAPGYYRGREAAIFMMRMLRPPGLKPHAWLPPTHDRR